MQDVKGVRGSSSLRLARRRAYSPASNRIDQQEIIDAPSSSECCFCL